MIPVKIRVTFNLKLKTLSDLTWNNLRDFHRVHYSPDNARFYTYGSLQLEEHLKALSEYLPKEGEKGISQKGNF